MNYIDIHSHLTEKRFDQEGKQNRHEIISEMKEKGIYTISIGVDWQESQNAVGLARAYKNVYASVGQHPVDNKEEVFDPKQYRQLIESNRDRIVCVGECGLDYYWPKMDVKNDKASEEDFESEKQRQIELFKTQIDLAVEMDLPLMLHVRSFENGDAHHDVFQILDQKQSEHGGKIRANFHFFTEAPEIAQMVVKRGFMLSFPGVITFADLDATVKSVPIEHIMSETDSPYAAPKPHRGKDATPLMVPYVVEKIAGLKDMDIDECRRQLNHNAQTFFKITT